MEEKTNKTVCILTAGKGTRIGAKADYFNKALLRVGNIAAISHTIEAFPEDTEFVIVLGYKGDIVRQYLSIAHPDRDFRYVEVDKYSEPGAGPGYAMMKCKDELQCPFYFVACDSIIDWRARLAITDKVDAPPHGGPMVLDHSWVGIWWAWPHSQAKPEDYCTVRFSEGGKIEEIYDKKAYGTKYPFVGVAFVKEYEEFWERLEKEKTTANGEIQVAPALCETCKRVAITAWWDTGSAEGLRHARENFEGIQNLDKLDEELYVVNDNVIKYFHNANMVKHRVQRIDHLGGMTPEVDAWTKNFYRYKFVPGSDFFTLGSPQIFFKQLLDETQEKLWSHTKLLDPIEEKIFYDVCKKFYYDKTMSRLDKLYKKTEPVKLEREGPSVDRLFNRINWDYLSKGTPAKFHGDYNFSNIVLPTSSHQGFTLLDWRQDFGGSIEYGDIYYDFAKMYHGFLFPHPSVKEEKFYCVKKKGKIKTFIEVPYHIELCKDIFEEWIEENGYDLWKVKILTAIVLLNMSPLHETPIDRYLYYFAKKYLEQVLNE